MSEARAVELVEGKSALQRDIDALRGELGGSSDEDAALLGQQRAAQAALSAAQAALSEKTADATALQRELDTSAADAKRLSVDAETQRAALVRADELSRSLVAELRDIRASTAATREASDEASESKLAALHSQIAALRDVHAAELARRAAARNRGQAARAEAEVR